MANTNRPTASIKIFQEDLHYLESIRPDKGLIETLHHVINTDKLRRTPIEDNRQTLDTIQKAIGVLKTTYTEIQRSTR